jgi:hypothetical protein
MTRFHRPQRSPCVKKDPPGVARASACRVEIHLDILWGRRSCRLPKNLFRILFGVALLASAGNLGRASRGHPRELKFAAAP